MNHRVLSIILFFFKESAELKEGLMKEEHYRAVNPSVWEYLFGIYGGGPPLLRSKIDIYGKEKEEKKKEHVNKS